MRTCRPLSLTTSSNREGCQNHFVSNEGWCRTEDHDTWTSKEVAQFERHHPIGSKARLAMALMLYTACFNVKLGEWRAGVDDDEHYV